MQREILLPGGRDLLLSYETTHLFHGSREPRVYVSRIWFTRSDGHSYTIMAYQHQRRPSARHPYWGIYRVEAWPHFYYYPEGNYTLLKGEMMRREALAQLSVVVADDPGHQHQYWTDEDIIRGYRDGTKLCLTAFCKKCHDWIYNGHVEHLIKAGNIEIKPSRWYAELTTSHPVQRASHDQPDFFRRRAWRRWLDHLAL